MSPEEDSADLMREFDALVAKHGDKALRPMVRILVEVLSKVVDATCMVRERCAKLERMPFSYEGEHELGKSYRRGQFVTHEGSVWHCNEDTAQRPVDPAWTLACKRGRDGRDMR